MKKIILLFAMLLWSHNAYSQLIVEDIANLPHNILSSIEAVQMVIEQVKQYKMMVDEFELMVKNSVAPYFYVYDEVQNFDKNVERLQQRFSKFSDSKAVDEYFKKYYDMNFYRSSPCFKAGGCSNEDLNMLSKQREERIKYMTEISSNIAKDMTEWASNQKERYNRLKRLDQEAKKAQGHFQIQSYQAQYMSEMTKELMELNSNMKAFQQYMVQLNSEFNIKNNIDDAYNIGKREWKVPKVKKWQLQYIGE